MPRPGDSPERARTFFALAGRGGLLVAVGAIASVASSAVRLGGLDLARLEPPVMCGGEAAAGTPGVLEASAASILCGREDVVIADTRSADEFARGHIAGAVHLPCTASSASAEDALSHFDEARTVLVYGHTTDDAMPVATTLRRRHADVRVLAGGFEGWAQAGLACASGPCDGCKHSKR